MRTGLTVAAMVLVLAWTASAQVVLPVEYRVTRTATGQPQVQHVFQKSAMTCDLAVASPQPGALRITDPERLSPARDCEWVDTTRVIFQNMIREVAYDFTIAARNNPIDGWTAESNAVRITLPRLPQIPQVPGNPRITPPAETPAFMALGRVVEPPYPVNLPGRGGRLQVAHLWLDAGIDAYFGASTLTTADGSYTVKYGDVIGLYFYNGTTP